MFAHRREIVWSYVYIFFFVFSTLHSNQTNVASVGMVLLNVHSYYYTSLPKQNFEALSKNLKIGKFMFIRFEKHASFSRPPQLPDEVPTLKMSN